VQACAPGAGFTFTALPRRLKDDTIATPLRHLERHRMLHKVQRPSLVLMLCLACVGASAQTPAPVAKAEPGCDAAVTEAIKRVRGKDAQEVQFLGAQRVQSQASDDETSVHGEGRYRSGARSMPFTYGCTINTKTGTASGVVFRETGDAAREQAAWQPDLTHVSPDACESATAALLKSKHPRVARISLDAETRQLRRGPDDRIVLEGHGAVERAPGMNATPFTYRCEIEPRNGRIVSVETGV
jgi:hypothetical protein